MMGKPENDVETYLDEKVAELDGFTRKWVSPGHSSVPDRIVFLPNGEVWFIEIKIRGDKPTTAQLREILRLQGLGHNAGYLAGRYEVTSFLSNSTPKFRESWMNIQMDYVEIC